MLAIALLDLAAHKGVDRAGLARSVEIDPAVSIDDRVPLVSVLSLWSVLIARFPSNHLGLELAMRWRAESLGLLGYVAANATTLGEALDRFLAFQALVDGETRMSRVVRDGVLVVTFARDPALSALRQPVESLLASGHAFFQLLSDTPFVARRVRLSHPSSLAAAPYRAFFGVSVEHGARIDELSYDASILDRPIPKADAKLGAYLLEATAAAHTRFLEARALSEADLAERLAREVKRRIAAHEPITIEATSKSLGTSVRALQRALAEEGTSFRDVIDGERRRVAELLLATPKASVSDVATELGFAEIASFSRAFKRWTRTSPAAFRKKIRA